MKTLIRISALIIAVIMLAVCLSACGGSAGETATIADSKTQDVSNPEDTKRVDIKPAETEHVETKPQKEEPKHPMIEDIDWHVGEEIVDGKRVVAFGYTNNTDYTICDVEIYFTEKSDITEEEKTEFIEDLKVIFDVDETNEEEAEDFKKFKIKPVGMSAESETITHTGESSEYERCTYYSGIYYVKKIEHYDLVTPDIATIKYIDEDKIVKIYYDFVNDKYTFDSKTESAIYWTTKGMGDVIPKPKAEIINKDTFDSATHFSFEVPNWTIDEFNAYVEECRAAGYNLNVLEYDDYYSADNAEGYNIYLNYYKTWSRMEGTIRAPINGSETTATD